MRLRCVTPTGLRVIPRITLPMRRIVALSRWSTASLGSRNGMQVTGCSTGCRIESQLPPRAPKTTTRAITSMTRLCLGNVGNSGNSSEPPSPYAHRRPFFDNFGSARKWCPLHIYAISANPAGVGAVSQASIPMGSDSSARIASGWRAKNG